MTAKSKKKIDWDLFVYFPSIQDIEEVCYPVAEQTFNDPEYKMPPLRWLERRKMESALGAVKNSYYQSIPELGAALIYYINKNHPLFEGNKRLSVIVLYSFLAMNYYYQVETLSVEESVRFVESIASSKYKDMDDTIAYATKWISTHFKYTPSLIRVIAKLVRRSRI